MKICLVLRFLKLIDINSASLIIMGVSMISITVLGVICAIEDFKICKRLIKDNNHD